MPFRSQLRRFLVIFLLVQKLRVGLAYQAIKITKTQLVPQPFERKEVMCGVQC